MEEDITTEINKIISYCRARECGECKYHRFLETEEICALHNPTAWEVLMEEDIKILEEMKNNCLTKRDYIDEKAERKAQAIENLINKNKELLEKVNYLEEIRANQTYENEELEKMVEIMSKTMHYICLFSSQSKYLIAKYCKIYNSENIGECEGSICSECVANYFRKKAKGE